MYDVRLLKQPLLYTPRGRGDIGYPRKRWEIETGTGRFLWPELKMMILKWIMENWDVKMIPGFEITLI
jgi:hypothetical protein